MKQKQRWAYGGMRTHVTRLQCTEHCLAWLRPDIYVSLKWLEVGLDNVTLSSMATPCCHVIGCKHNGAWHCTRSLPWTFSILSFQTIKKVCPVCCKRVFQTVIIQYYPCRCIRQMCPDCDAALEKSGKDSCDMHMFSSRETSLKRMCKWPFNYLLQYTEQMCHFDLCKYANNISIVYKCINMICSMK